VKKQLAEVEADTAKMRGLGPKARVPEHFISGAEMKYRLTQRTLQEYTPDMAHLDATTLWLLLFIDNRNTDLRQLQIDFSGSAVLGFYNSEKKELCPDRQPHPLATVPRNACP
jgi:hypothetical protein